MDFSFMGGTGQDGSWQANPDFLKMLGGIGSSFGQGKSAGEAIGNPVMEALRMQALQGNNPQVNKLTATPKGQPGPDAITTKETADGITQTIQTPSERNLNTYGTSVPPETIRGGEHTQSPFWEALLGQLNNRQG